MPCTGVRPVRDPSITMRLSMVGLAWAVATTLLALQGDAAPAAKTSFKMDGDVLVIDNPTTFEAAIKVRERCSA